MKKVIFTLHDSSDLAAVLDVDLHSSPKDEYTVKEEQALALIINNLFPELKKCHRRIKKLMVVDEDGNTYETQDFDIYGSLALKEKEL